MLADILINFYLENEEESSTDSHLVDNIMENERPSALVAAVDQYLNNDPSATVPRDSFNKDSMSDNSRQNLFSSKHN